MARALDQRDERRYISQHLASEALTQDGESTTLHIGQSQPAPSQLCFQRSILFAKKGNHITLLALQPSEQRREKELKRNHGPSLL